MARAGPVMAELQAFSDPAALPPDARALLDSAALREFQLGQAWFAAVAAAALPPGSTPLLLLYREAGRALALLALQRGRNGRLAGLTTPYTCVFRPLAAADATPAELMRAGAAFGRFCRARGPLRLDALDTAWPGLPPLLAGLRGAGLVALPFAHFLNWHLDVAGLDWDAYLAGRPGELRETIRRRLARAGRDKSVTFELITGSDALAAGIAAYEAVYARSWKQPEPFPAFTARLLPAAAAAGVLRLAVLRQGDVPIAAQYWTLAGGVATVLKLAHDEAARALSPGTVLTALTIRHLLRHDAVTALDFGRGDDAYKAGWTGQVRTRGGVLLCPWRHPRGLALLGRHLLGRYLPRRFRR